jgi:cytochrome P450
VPVSEFDSSEFFTNEALVDDPYTYYAEQRSQCPVRVDPNNGIVAVTGYEAALSVYRDTEGFSACNAVLGPFTALPFEPSGDDIRDQIAHHRDQLPFSGYMATLDPPRHSEVRGLLSRLMTPRRLKENEEFMWSLADQQLDNFVPSGKGDFLNQYARSFAMLAIADLLGVPAEDHDDFREKLAASRSASEEAQEVAHNPLEFLEERFTEYIVARRRMPGNDVMTFLAQAKYPDESTPDVVDVVHLATFLFAAGQETTTQMLSFAMRELAQRPDLQQRLREDSSLIPNFLEETLRMESPIKSHFRLASKTTTIGGVPAPAGRTIMLLLGAFNRDPARFEDPDEFNLDRPNLREHVAFGRGAHTCPGASLARVEGRVTFERVLARMGDIRISEPHHGLTDERRYSYDPTFFVRGLKELHIEFTPVA